MLVVSVSSLPVGVLLWNSPEPCLTVLAKMTLSFGPSGFEIAAAQAPIRGPAPSAFSCPLELWHPGDFAPRKVGCDVLLSGNAYADAPSSVIGANVRIGAVKKRFYALSGERSNAIPLSLAYLREQPSPDSPEVTVGALSAEHPERDRFRGVEAVRPSELKRLSFPSKFDYSYFNAAPEDQQIDALSPGMAVMLHGLSPGGTAVRGTLPSKQPRLFFPDERAGYGLHEIPLRCDTIWFDTDSATCELVFRGTISLGRRAGLPSRLVVVLAEATEALDPAKIEARAAFARPERAVDPEDVEGIAPPVARQEIEEIEEIDADPATEEAHEVAATVPVVDRPPRARRGTVIMETPAAPVAAPPEPPPSEAEGPLPTRQNKGDPDRTMLHTGLPVRPHTLPFATGGGQAPSRDTMPPPPTSGLPFLSPRRGATIEVPAEKNPVLAALPFDDRPFLRPRTVDVAKGAVAQDPLPFKPIAPAPAPAPALPPAEDEDEPRTLRPPPIAEDIDDPATLPPPAAAPTFDLAPDAEPATLPPPAAAPTFGLPDETLVPPPGTEPPPAPIPLAPRVPGALDPLALGTPWTTLGSPGPSAPPWAAGLVRGEGDAKPLQTKPIEKLGLFTVEEDAEIQLALWESEAPIHETLAKLGTDELKWREHRRLRDAALREEAETGGTARALAVHEALENAKRKRRPAAAPSLDLEAYAAVRVVMREAEASDEPAVLAARGIDVARWEQDHRYYRKRLLKEPAFAERFHAALREGAEMVSSTSAPDSPSGAARQSSSRKGPEPRPLRRSRIKGNARPARPRGSSI